MARTRANVTVATEIELPALTGPQIDILEANERLLLVEGSPRSAKSWGVAFKIWKLAWEHPGIQIFYSRYKDESLSQLRDIWSKVGAFFPSYLHPKWNSTDQSWDFPNGPRAPRGLHYGSRVYLSSIKASELDTLHSKYKGKTLAVIVVEEANELPRENYFGLKERLSQSKKPDGTTYDYPLQMILVTNCVDEDHWIAQEWPDGSDEPGYRRTIRVPLASNAHNLGPTVMAGYERDYPLGHPLRPTVVEGQRGVTLVGKPVYGGYFLRDIHVSTEVRRNPLYPVLVGWDFGQEKPAVVFAQYLAHLGALRVLGAVKGAELYLHVFAPKVLEIQRRWFGELDPRDMLAWCDPTGDTGNGGLEATPVRMLQSLHVPAQFDGKANHAGVRYGAVQVMAGFLGREARDGSPAFQLHPRCIELVKDGATVKERMTDLLVRAFDVGYIWDEHAAPDTNPNIRKPKKGTRYDDLMNALEYIVIGQRLTVPHDTAMLRADRKYAARLAKGTHLPHPSDALVANMKEFRALQRRLKDKDPDDPRPNAVSFSRGGYYGGGGRGGFGGYGPRGGY